jgi:hypothetical protein
MFLNFIPVSAVTFGCMQMVSSPPDELLPTFTDPVLHGSFFFLPAPLSSQDTIFGLIKFNFVLQLLHYVQIFHNQQWK